MQDIKFKIQGLEQVKSMLRTLPQEINAKLMRDLHRSAARVVKTEIASSVPESNSDKRSADKMVNNVGIENAKDSKTGVNVGFKRRVWYSMLIERGTRLRTTKGKGRYKKKAVRGRIKPHPFLSRAHQSAVPKAVEYLANNYLRIINRSIKKQLRGLKMRST
jgi:HK97 gp10 family phage protein